jgi:hypothetical protein
LGLRLDGCSVVFELETEAASEHRNFQDSKPKPNQKIDNSV